MVDLKQDQKNSIEIYCYNKSTIAIAKNSVFYGKTKHIKIKYHFIREVEKEKEVDLMHCSSEVQMVDILTKVLPRIGFE